MRILYVANFDAGGNRDEQAISWAFHELGYDVIELRERDARKAPKIKADMLLFHKWSDSDTLSSLSGKMTRVCWYFDLVDYSSDPTLRARCNNRKLWMQRMTPHIDHLFCTDGDWVDQLSKTRTNVYKLSQGADSQIIGRWEDNWTVNQNGPILFAGIRKGGQGRQAFVSEMKKVYGNRFLHVERDLYREDLKELVSRSLCVTCPIEPVTNNYWSNRIYNAAGFGALVLHPRSSQLRHHYDKSEILFYSSMEDLHKQIESIRSQPAEHIDIMKNALERTEKEHTYFHRCETLIKHVQREGY